MSEEDINNKEYDLTICIPALVERIDKVSEFVKKIEKQINDNDYKDKVQLLISLDNRSVPLKDKRNKAQARSTGKYLCHIDDDDDITNDFIKEIMDAIQKVKETELGHVDVITYDQLARLEDGRDITVKSNIQCHSLELTPLRAEGEETVFIRYPWQWCCWRTSLVKGVYRDDYDQGPKFEDINWLKKVRLRYPKSQYNIDKVLHIFNGRRLNGMESACGW